MSGSQRLIPSKLKKEIVRRGWQGCDLAQRAHLSAPTVSAALAGRPLKVATLLKIAKALAATTPIQELDDLLDEFLREARNRRSMEASDGSV
jgi:transcriptional regulator with XRE-family HTH domain